MAFSGLHVACGYAAGRGNSGVILQLLGPVVWSETLAVAGTTIRTAPAEDAPLGAPLMSIRASVDVYVATGPAPDATAGPRRFLAANVDLNQFVRPGDKLAWIPA